MAKITAYGNIFRDWESLLGSCTQNPELLTGVEPLKSDMDALLAQARDLKIQQEDLTGKRQAMTQSLTEVVDLGREAARKLRSFVITRLGTKSELLSQFGIPPRRRRARKAKASPASPAPEMPQPPKPAA